MWVINVKYLRTSYRLIFAASGNTIPVKMIVGKN